jgi:hypothetical protein
MAMRGQGHRTGTPGHCATREFQLADWMVVMHGAHGVDVAGVRSYGGL